MRVLTQSCHCQSRQPAIPFQLLALLALAGSRMQALRAFECLADNSQLELDRKEC